jgi:hypothetical protein
LVREPLHVAHRVLHALGEAAEAELFDWLQWFDANGFKPEKGAAKMDPTLGMIGVLLGKHSYQRMVRGQTVSA